MILQLLSNTKLALGYSIPSQNRDMSTSYITYLLAGLAIAKLRGRYSIQWFPGSRRRWLKIDLVSK